MIPDSECSKCEQCNGSGIVSTGKCTCIGCKKGYHNVRLSCGRKNVKCEQCDGHGKLRNGKFPCPKCEGTGKKHKFIVTPTNGKQLTIEGGTAKPYKVCAKCGCRAYIH